MSGPGSRTGAYGSTPAAGTDFRKTWDRSEYEAKAKQRDEEERVRMKEADEAIQKGKKPRRRQVDLPKPTELMKQREAPLELSKNQNKTMIVQGNIRGPGAPGFYCDVCSRTSKDSSSYLDHLNSRFHKGPHACVMKDLRQLGQKTQVERSTLSQVRAKIAQLRELTKLQSSSKEYDFTKRLREIREAEQSEREAKRLKKLELKEKKLSEVSAVEGIYKVYSNGDDPQDGRVERDDQPKIDGGADDEMAKLMGFSGGFKPKNK